MLISGRVPQQFSQVLLGSVNQGWAILLFLNLLMLNAGAFPDLTAIMLIVVPLSLPLQLGVDPVHFGVIVQVNLMLGGLALITYVPGISLAFVRAFF